MIYLLSLIVISGCYDKVEPVVLTKCDSLNVVYNDTIKSIINLHCAIPYCHVTGFGPGDWTDYSQLKERVDNGKFEQFIFATNPFMPAGGDTLTQEELDKLQCWVDAGAPNN